MLPGGDTVSASFLGWPSPQPPEKEGFPGADALYRDVAAAPGRRVSHYANPFKQRNAAVVRGEVKAKRAPPRRPHCATPRKPTTPCLPAPSPQRPDSGQQAAHPTPPALPASPAGGPPALPAPPGLAEGCPVCGFVPLDAVSSPEGGSVKDGRMYLRKADGVAWEEGEYVQEVVGGVHAAVEACAVVLERGPTDPAEVLRVLLQLVDAAAGAFFEHLPAVGGRTGVLRPLRARSRRLSASNSLRSSSRGNSPPRSVSPPASPMKPRSPTPMSPGRTRRLSSPFGNHPPTFVPPSPALTEPAAESPVHPEGRSGEGSPENALGEPAFGMSGTGPDTPAFRRRLGSTGSDAGTPMAFGSMRSATAPAEARRAAVELPQRHQDAKTLGEQVCVLLTQGVGLMAEAHQYTADRQQLQVEAEIQMLRKRAQQEVEDHNAAAEHKASGLARANSERSAEVAVLRMQLDRERKRNYALMAERKLTANERLATQRVYFANTNRLKRDVLDMRAELHRAKDESLSAHMQLSTLKQQVANASELAQAEQQMRMVIEEGKGKMFIDHCVESSRSLLRNLEHIYGRLRRRQIQHDEDDRANVSTGLLPSGQTRHRHRRAPNATPMTGYTASVGASTLQTFAMIPATATQSFLLPPTDGVSVATTPCPEPLEVPAPVDATAAARLASLLHAAEARLCHVAEDDPPAQYFLPDDSPLLVPHGLWYRGLGLDITVPPPFRAPADVWVPSLALSREALHAQLAAFMALAVSAEVDGEEGKMLPHRPVTEYVERWVEQTCGEGALGWSVLYSVLHGVQRGCGDGGAADVFKACLERRVGVWLIAAVEGDADALREAAAKCAGEGSTCSEAAAAGTSDEVDWPAVVETAFPTRAPHELAGLTYAAAVGAAELSADKGAAGGFLAHFGTAAFKGESPLMACVRRQGLQRVLRFRGRVETLLVEQSYVVNKTAVVGLHGLRHAVCAAWEAEGGGGVEETEGVYGAAQRFVDEVESICKKAVAAQPAAARKRQLSPPEPDAVRASAAKRHEEWQLWYSVEETPLHIATGTPLQSLDAVMARAPGSKHAEALHTTDAFPMVGSALARESAQWVRQYDLAGALGQDDSGDGGSGGRSPGIASMSCASALSQLPVKNEKRRSPTKGKSFRKLKVSVKPSDDAPSPSAKSFRLPPERDAGERFPLAAVLVCSRLVPIVGVTQGQMW